MAGYSGTPLIRKLGIHAGSKVWLFQAPAEYFDWMGQDIGLQCCKNPEEATILHLFVNDQNVLEAQMRTLRKIMQSDAAMWISWYKKSAKLSTSLTEDRIRQLAFSMDLVDVKVCAVSEIWSGLKLVIPLAKRT